MDIYSHAARNKGRRLKDSGKILSVGFTSMWHPIKNPENKLRPHIVLSGSERRGWELILEKHEARFIRDWLNSVPLID